MSPSLNLVSWKKTRYFHIQHLYGNSTNFNASSIYWLSTLLLKRHQNYWNIEWGRKMIVQGIQLLNSNSIRSPPRPRIASRKISHFLGTHQTHTINTYSIVPNTTSHESQTQSTKGGGIVWKILITNGKESLRTINFLQTDDNSQRKNVLRPFGASLIMNIQVTTSNTGRTQQNNIC